MKVRIEQEDGSFREHTFVSLSERRRILLSTKPEHRWIDRETKDIIITREPCPIKKCSQCEGPISWTFRVTGGFVGGVGTLYYYGCLLREDPTFTLNANAWACDSCKIAGFFPPQEKTDGA